MPNHIVSMSSSVNLTRQEPTAIRLFFDRNFDDVLWKNILNELWPFE